MSSNLYWKPPEPEGKTLGDELKFALREYFGGEMWEWQTLGRGDIGFLRGLVAGARAKSSLGEDAQFLIDKIERYGSVDVREHS